LAARATKNGKAAKAVKNHPALTNLDSAWIPSVIRETMAQIISTPIA
jgi:hypothetical protein